MMDGPLRSRLDAIAAGTTPLAGTLMNSLPYGWAISRGLVVGESLIVEGRGVLAAGSYTPIWPGGVSYPWPVADQTLRVVSDSANDNPASTGAFTLRLWWLDVAGDESTTDVNLNGVGMVDSTAVTARRLNKARVVTCGVTGWNEGNITIYATDGVTLLGYIPLGCNCTCQAIQTTPRGKKDVLWYWSTPYGGSLTFLWARATPADAFTTRWLQYLTSYRTIPTELPVPIVLPAGTDYYLSNTAPASAQGSVSGYRIPV